MNNKYGMSVSDLGGGQYPRDVPVEGASGGTVGVAPRDSDFAPRRGGDNRAMGLPAQEARTRAQPQPPISNQSGSGLLLPGRRFGSFTPSNRAAGAGIGTVGALPAYEEPQLGGDRLERAAGLASAAGTDRRNNGSRSVAPAASSPAANALGRRDHQGRIGGQTRFVGGLAGPKPTVAGRRVEDAAASRGSSWGFGPRTVTREDLTRLDDEIANLSKTVEQVRIT